MEDGFRLLFTIFHGCFNSSKLSLIKYLRFLRLDAFLKLTQLAVAIARADCRMVFDITASTKVGQIYLSSVFRIK